VHRIGPSPYLHYQPTWLNRPTRSLACTHAVLTARRRRPPATAPTTATSSRPPRAAHAAATPCAMPIAGARALESRARQLHGRLPPQGAAVGRPCRPAATSAPRATHAAAARALTLSLSVRRRSRPLLFSYRRLPPLVPLRPHDPTNSVDRARRCSPTSPTEPTTAD
jgi:hypothetical protein